MFEKLIIIGNVGQDPEYNLNEKTGETYLNLSVAVTKGKDENKRTKWYECSVKADSHIAKYCSEYIRCGDKVYIEGYPVVNAYVNKERQLIANIQCKMTQANLIASKKPLQNASSLEQTNYDVDDSQIPEQPAEVRLASLPVAAE